MESTAHTLVNLAVILQTYGQFDEALTCAEAAYRLDPADKRVVKLYAEALLRRGDLARGWPLFTTAHTRYDWLSPTVPEWHGEPLADRRLLVFAYGGNGDNIYFLRFLLNLPATTFVTFLSPPTLAPLARTLGIDVVENWNGNFDLDFARYDYHTPINAIPQYQSVTYENFFAGPSFLRVEPRPRFHLRRRTGFCWRAGEGKSPRYTRSLNWDQRQRILARLPRRYVDLSDLSGSWLDTAALIASLDRVVTVDTGVAHLAGALGVPTSVILPGASAWHYPVGWPRHPFYPSMHMFHRCREGMDAAVDLLLEVL